MTLGTRRVAGTCSILVLVPGGGQFAIALSEEVSYNASGTFPEPFWLKIEDTEAGAISQLAHQLGAYKEITMGTATGVITGTLPTTILVEIPFDSARLRNLDRSTLKLWIYRDGEW